MNAIEVLEIGDSLGFVLPEEVLKLLKVGVGDTLFLTEAERGFTLTTVDPQSVQGGVADTPTQEALPQAANQNKK